MNFALIILLPVFAIFFGEIFNSSSILVLTKVNDSHGFL